ncbi:hypothetical protein MNBD_ALPHA08-1108 [hydrothermal vent metagenome]|uniref:Nitroreductase domain-containing protein n=1 Tax=hydrothermal vent metagenome TaxID=652676 RepID=A0A3B0SBN5_9ZZZZ
MSRKLPGPVANKDLNDLSSPLRLLQTRRSALAKFMREPGPTGAQVDQLLEMAVRVPDHGKMAPWRFIVFSGTARAKMGDVLAGRWQQLHPEHGKETIDQQRKMFLQAPVVIGVVSSITDTRKIPAIEQELSAGALCQNLLLAATTMGFGCQWITGWFAYDRDVVGKMGLEAHENIAGFIYIGTASEELTDRPRPDHKSLTTHWKG